MTARILDVSPDEYHTLPHFSSSVAKELIAKSPLHAKSEVGKKPTKGMDRGSIVHRIALGKGKEYEVVVANDWRTKDAKAEAARIRADGKVPVLECDLEEYTVAAGKVVAQLAERGIVLDGESELAIEWEEQTPHGPVLCKAMLDHCWRAIGLILDLKITENAAPSAVERTAENLGYGVQWAAYTRALAALDPDLADRIGFAFAFCEPDEPWAVNVTEPDGLFRELGERRWLRAVSTWAECSKNNRWPSYGSTVNPLSAPTWALAREGAPADER